MNEAEARNRAFWDDDADAYQAVHGAALADRPLAWGIWRVPDAEVGALGELAGCTVLELGCGAAQWSAALAAAGAHAVGLDQSTAQLRHARRTGVPLALASASSLPFGARSFDAVVSDHGAMSFCDPACTVPEIARVLRPGGRLAFCILNPLVYWTYDRRHRRQTRTLHNPASERLFDTGEGTVDYVITPAEWLRTFRTHGLAVDGLVELCRPDGATTTFDDVVPPDWAARWPAEHLWIVRKP